jgi:DNA-binding transcriptional ArsR family regulator
MGIDHTAKLHHPDRDQIELPGVLHALSDPQRLEIVRTLAESSAPCPCGSIKLGVAKSTMTHHYRVLRESGVIRQRREGTTKLTELRREDLDTRFPGLLDAVLSSERVHV